jgi:transcriptional regulator with GAF, ATPase, and Fis domain
MASREQRLIETLILLADTLVGDFDVLDLFYVLVDSVPDLVDVDEAGLLLADEEGDLRVMAVTSESVKTIELLQIHTSSGPCFDAFASGEMVMASFSEPAAMDRWPVFAGAALEAGFGSIVAIPMRLRDHALGALNLFRASEDYLPDEEVAAARALTDMATIAILQNRAAHDSDVLVNQLQQALNSRVIIEQAKGVIAQKMDVDMEKAFAHLRNYSQNHNVILRRVAEDVVSGVLDSTQLLD